jgi:hypothetical protein
MRGEALSDAISRLSVFGLGSFAPNGGWTQVVLEKHEDHWLGLLDFVIAIEIELADSLAESSGGRQEVAAVGSPMPN